MKFRLRDLECGNLRNGKVVKKNTVSEVRSS